MDHVTMLAMMATGSVILLSLLFVFYTSVTVYCWIGIPWSAAVTSSLTQILSSYLFSLILKANIPGRIALCLRKRFMASRGEQTLQEPLLLGATMVPVVVADLDGELPGEEATLLQPV